MRSVPPTIVSVILLACLAGACESRTVEDSDSVAPSTEAPELPATTTWTVDAEGISRIRTGISVAALAQALGTEISPVYDVNSTCTHVTPPGLPAGVRLMIVNDTVARVEVDSAGVETAEGAGVGDTESEVVALYQGRVEVQPHKYTGPQGHYVVVSPPGDTLHRIIFETDGQHVLNFRAGRIPAVQFVEGCA